MNPLRKLLVVTLAAIAVVCLSAPTWAQSKLLSENVLITKCADAAGAATSDVTGSTIDMAGWDGVLFVTSYGTPAANNLIHVEQGAASNMSDAADLAGGEVDLSGASDEDQWIDLVQPRERYVRCIAQRGTSSTLENLWAIQYRGKSRPQTNLTSGTIYGKRLIRPAEGTK
jgi:hypothetical protein